MLNAIKSFFDANLGQLETKKHDEHAIKLATAALLIEMMRMDDHVSTHEEDALLRLMTVKFQLSKKETEELIKLAEMELADSTDYYQFTSLINEQFAYEEKVHIIELLWQVAYSDMRLDKDEEYLVRKISELIYVSHADFISTKHKVRPPTD